MKFGIIGTNFVSDFFMAGAAQIEECEVVAVCDILEEGARRFSEKYRIPYYFASYSKMYEANLIDAVYVAVPNAIHKEITMFFLERKIPVFCEKPMAGNAKHVKEMVACARENNTYLHEGLVPLYSPNFTIIKENIPKVGKIRQVNITMSQYSSRYDAYLRGENPTTFNSQLSNGATMDLGVYVFAECIALFGKPLKIMSAATLLDTGADVSGASILVYDGFQVNLAYSKASDTENKVEICGEDGLIILNHTTRINSVVLVDRKSKERTELAVETKELFYYEIKEMIEQLSIGQKEAVSVPLELSEIIHEILTESRRQAGIKFPCD